MMNPKSSRLLKSIDMKQMPWKNGGGVTSEVAISPAGATTAALDFDWRVSIAQVDSAGPFSLFPGYDRQLVVWKGEGLLINGVSRARLECFEFAGETPVMAELVSGPVRDFGVITRRGRSRCEMSVRRLAVDEDLVLDGGQGEVFVLCARGELQIEGFYLNSGDVFHGSGFGSFQVRGLERSEIVVALVS